MKDQCDRAIVHDLRNAEGLRAKARKIVVLQCQKRAGHERTAGDRLHAWGTKDSLFQFVTGEEGRPLAEVNAWAKKERAADKANR